MDAWSLPLLTFFPLVGVAIILFLKPEAKNAIRWVTVLTALVNFGISLWVLSLFSTNNPDLQLVVNIPWIEVAGFNITFQMGSRRTQHSAALVDHIFNPDFGSRQLDDDQRRRQELYDLLPAVRNGDARRFCVAGFVPVLYLLGIQLGADVLLNRCIWR